MLTIDDLVGALGKEHAELLNSIEANRKQLKAADKWMDHIDFNVQAVRGIFGRDPRVRLKRSPANGALYVIVTVDVTGTPDEVMRKVDKHFEYVWDKLTEGNTRDTDDVAWGEVIFNTCYV